MSVRTSEKSHMSGAGRNVIGIPSAALYEAPRFWAANPRTDETLRLVHADFSARRIITASMASTMA